MQEYFKILANMLSQVFLPRFIVLLILTNNLNMQVGTYGAHRLKLNIV